MNKINKKSKKYMDSLLKAIENWELSWTGFKDNNKGEWWLLLQVLLILAHFINAYPIISIPYLINILPIRILSILLIVYGSYLAIIALLRLGENLSPLPEPKVGSCLVTEGIYKITRHPLYRSLILISIGTTLFFGSLYYLILNILFSFVLICKAKREERSLILKYKLYSDYMKKTPAIFKGLVFLDWRK